VKVAHGHRLCLLLLAALVAACSCQRGKTGAAAIPLARETKGAVEVNVAKVGYDRSQQAHYVLLREDSRGRVLPVYIGDVEAQAIALALHGVKPERPLTADLLSSVIEKTGNHVDRVVIDQVRDEVFFASIYMDNGRYSVDSRPSDAIALAIRAGAPIFVASKLLETSIPGEVISRGTLPSTVHALGITVQELTPALGRVFDASAKTGVLVSDVAEPARGAGIQRGDVITRIDGHRIKALGDFSRDVSAAAGGAVTLTLARDGAEHAVTIKR
jgi:uncharacterized protein